MLNPRLFTAALCAAFALSGVAQAQVLEGGVELVEQVSGLKVEPKETGHEKCQGQGHLKDAGNGHDDGECDEREPGPVATEACYASEYAPESSWQRYSCTLTTYNEHYLTDTIANNESYPETLAAFATGEVTALQGDATTFTGELIGAAGAGDLAGAVEAADGFIDALDQYLPSGPVPIGPGPVLDDLGQYSTALIADVSSGNLAGAVDATLAFIDGADQWLPSGPVPIGPGPVLDDTTEYATALTGSISSGDLAGAQDATLSFISGADQWLPSGPVPIGPGPVLDDTILYSTALVTDLSTGDLSRAVEDTETFINSYDQWLPSGPVPIGPGPVLDDYEVQLPSYGF